MNFTLTGNQQEIKERAAEFADREVAPHAADLDREDRVPFETLEKLADEGFMGLCVPEEYGGAGADFLSYCLLIEEISRADAGVGVTLAVHTSAGTLPILAYGTEEQKDRWVPPLARGERIGSFALTEPNTGSDAAAIEADSKEVVVRSLPGMGLVLTTEFLAEVGDFSRFGLADRSAAAAGLVPGSGFRSRPPASAEPGRVTAPWWGSSTARRSCSPAMSRARNTTGGSRLKGKALRKRSWH